MRQSAFLCLLITVLTAGSSCGEYSTKKKVKAELSISHGPSKEADDIEIKTTLTNTSGQELKPNLLAMDYPSLYLEIRDPSGKVINNIPAAVPPANTGEQVTLKPGERLEFTARGFPVSDELVKKGRYTIRCTVQLPCGQDGKEKLSLESEWIAVEIE